MLSAYGKTDLSRLKIGLMRGAVRHVHGVVVTSPALPLLMPGTGQPSPFPAFGLVNPKPDSSSQFSQKKPHPFSPSTPQRSPRCRMVMAHLLSRLAQQATNSCCFVMGVGEGGSIMLRAPLLRGQLPVSHGSASLLHWKFFAARPAGVWSTARVHPCLRGRARWEGTVKARSGLCCLHGNLSRFPFPFLLFWGMF